MKTLNSNVSFRVKELVPNVYHLEFNSQRDLTSTLVRFQEYYESPKFRNKIFNFKDFIKWYKTTRKGRFTYFSDWSGFNFPSSILNPFKSNQFKDLSLKEKKVLNIFSSKKGKFYVIGTYKSKNKVNNLEIKKHELAHSLFYLNSKYKKSVINLLKKVPKKKAFKYFKSLGYHPSVFLDELHAYLLTDQGFINIVGMNKSDCLKIVNGLEKLYKKYINQKN